MATSRLYYHNLCTQATFGGFAVAGSAVANEATTWSEFTHYAAGRATLEGQGTFTGNVAVDYAIEVHISTDGTLANARWRWSDTGGATWNAQNLVFQHNVWIPLSNGMEVRWLDTTGTRGTPQAVLGDYHYARALRSHGIVKALDGSRNTEYRSGAMPVSSTLQIGWDFGSAQQPGFLGAKDHNLPANATISIRAHASTLFSGSPSHNQAVTWRANGDMAELISSSGYRYWWLNVVMGATALTYLRLSEFGLWTGATFLKPPSIGYTFPLEFQGSIDTTRVTRGPHPRVYAATMRQYTWQGAKSTPAEDGGKLNAAFAYAQAHESYVHPSFWFIQLDDDLTTVEYNGWLSPPDRQHRFLDRADYGVSWGELLRTVSP